MSSTLLKMMVLIGASLPFFWLIALMVADNLGANPIEAMTHFTGIWALRLLWITLAMTPLRLAFNCQVCLKQRRMLGLLAFFYASLHVLIYLVLDQQFVIADIVEDVVKRPYITVGFVAFCLLIPLAITSNRGMMKCLGRNWKRLHQLVYIIAPFAVLHFLWLVKKDMTEPLIYLVILMVLLGYRVWYAKFKL